MILGIVLASSLDSCGPDEQQAPDEDTSSKIHGIDEQATSEHVDSGVGPDSIRRIVHEPYTGPVVRRKPFPGIHGIAGRDGPGGMKLVEYMEPMVKPLSRSPGNWIVTGDETRRDEVIVLNGNLVVEPGGNLTLINVTLYLDCSYDGEWQIRVKSGGRLNILSGSIITAYNTEYEFLFYVYGSLIMRDSELHECGYSWSYPGLWLETNEGVIIENSIISNNYIGITCYSSSSVSISGCYIANNSDDGIYCRKSSDIGIHYCNIYGNRKHGLLNEGPYTVNATYNWWNSTTGPEYKAEGDPHDPEEVYGDVIYEPWLTGPVRLLPVIEILSPANEAIIEDDTVTVEWRVVEGSYSVVRSR